MRVVAVNAGLGDPSSTRLLVDRLVDAVAERAVRDGPAVDVEVIDLRDLAVDVARSLTTGFAVGGVRAAVDAVHAADGLIVATPVFNASYSGLFKSFFDLVEVDRMQGVPVVIAATGGSPRHSMVLDHAMRPLFAYLRAVVLPTAVYAAAEDWAGTSGDTALLSDRIRRAATELVAALRSTQVAPGGRVPANRSDTDGFDRRGSHRSAVEQAGIANFAKLLGEQD
ncbi:CE1759 family FMN reductase [Gordonia hankookensis]|uniref:NAD(P)H-dependent oxidoreductase n=1 Tax=Gordonia hankookensis TaxID=589403 RepID=A0ABR7WAK1_9ACTN|nr:CE1759 family FMN reductase [Gordonia hankookensis]MBD1318779.1 NAD(P)H-dependent oxidoreductase [Gordonia hankookensis]